MADAAERLVIDLEARVNKFEQAFQRANRTANDNWRSIENRGQQAANKLDAGFTRVMKPRSIKLDVHAPTAEVSGLQRALDSLHVPEGLNFEHLKASLGGVAAGLGLNEVRKLADEWTNAGNRIAAAGVAASALPDTLDRVSGISERARGSLEQSAQVYASLTRAGKEFGATQAQVAIGTETVIKALSLSGSNTAQIEGALSDLAQGLQRGVLQGQELKALLGEVPAIAEAIAKEFGVSVGEVKELGTAGKLTSERVFKALVSAAGDVNKAFANTKPTIEQSFNVLETAATRFVGQNSAMQLATSGTAAALQSLASHFGLLANGAGALGLVIATRLVANGLTPLATGLLTSARAAASAAAAQIEFSSIVGTSIVRMGAASLAARGLSAALAFVGGPVGAALLGITAATVFFTERAQDAEERSKRYADALADLKAKAETAAGGVRHVGDEVSKTAAEMDAVQINRLSQQLKQAEADAGEAAEKLRQLSEFTQAYGSTAPDGAALKSFFAAIEKGLHGNADAALAAEQAIAALANSDPSFQPLADSFLPLLERLAGVRASVAATKAAIASLSATPAPAAAGPSPYGTLDGDAIKKSIGDRLMKERIEDSKNTDASRARKKMTDILGSTDGTVTPGQAYKTGLQEIAIEDAPSAKRGNGRTRKAPKTDAEKAEDRVQAQLKSLEEERRKTEAEAATIDKSPAEKRAAEELSKNNVKADSEDGRKIVAVTKAIEDQKAATERLEESRKKLAEAGNALKDGFADALDEIIVKGGKASDVFANLARQLESQLLKGLLTGGGSFGGLTSGLTGSGGLLGSLFGGVSKSLGFATGGEITGPGNGTSDSILARVSAGEFVVNAKATKANLSLLHALNSGKLPAFATGGVVGSSTAAPSLRGGSGGSAGGAGNVTIHHTTNVTANGGTPDANQDLARRVSAETEAAMRRIVISEVGKQRRPGGAFYS